MATVEIGQFDLMLADIIVGRLQADGIAAFPLPFGGARGGRRMAGILVEEEDAEAARKIIAAGDVDFPA